MNFKADGLPCPVSYSIAALATMLSAYSGASSSEGNSPVQPVAFRHTVHVDTLKMNCLYCHFSATKSPDPGLPAVGTCMGCHTVVATETSRRSQKLAGVWNKKQPVPWVRIHKLPEYVHFPHMRHVNAGVTCQTCHGDVQNMKQVYQAELAQHGLVRELSRRTVESAAHGALRLRVVSLLSRMSTEQDHRAPTRLRVKRRDFLKVSGATAAATTMLGCTSEQVEKLIPYLVSPDETVPGVSTYYATTCRECSAACGVIAETRDGRAIKLEGNPDHPVNRGALCARGQAALQGLYNPDRYRGPMVRRNGRLESIDLGRSAPAVRAEARRDASRGGAANAVFINQHESGSFPGFLNALARGSTECPRTSAIDPGRGPRRDRREQAELRRCVAAPRFLRGAG